MGLTISGALSVVSQELRRAKFEPGPRDPEILIEEATGRSISELRREPGAELTSKEQELLFRWVEELIRGVPLAYVIGNWDFWGYRFRVGPGVLIPRPETEILVEETLKWVQQNDARRGMDWGAGTGCVGLTIALEAKVKITLVEKSQEALFYANENRKRLGEKFKDRDLLGRTDVLEIGVELLSVSEPLDFIVANPPYIALGDSRVEDSVRDYEPEEALYSGPDGLEAIRIWTQKAAEILRPGGLWIFEIGNGQAAEAVQCVQKTSRFRSLQVLRDLAGHERIVSAERVEWNVL